jgi:hypothetical protein
LGINKVHALFSIIVNSHFEFRLFKDETENEKVKQKLLQHVTTYYPDPSALLLSPWRKCKERVDVNIVETISNNDRNTYMDKMVRSEMNC